MGPRRPRPPTRGILLDKMTRSMGRRLPVAIAEGKRRPHEPVQAAKFASEAGVIVRSQIPILTHWKEYKKDTEHLDNFVGKLAGRLAINTTDKPTKDACASVLQSGIRQMRYRLKQAYFNGVAANEIRTTSPVSSMTDEQWNQLVAKWSTGKSREISEKNKENRAKVKYHQGTGSCSYVAQLHAHRQKKKDEARELQAAARAADGELEDMAGGELQDAPDELQDVPDEEVDAVEVFKECQTSRRKGLTEIAKDAISNMEALKAQPPAEGEAPITSAQVVSKVLSQNCNNNTFLKNIGLKPTSPTKPSTSTERERVLEEQLAVERKAAAALYEEVSVLKQKSKATEGALERTQRQLEENQKALQDNNALLRSVLLLNSNRS